MNPPGVDPITLELLKNALQTAVDEAAYVLGRTCASQLLKDAQDFSVGLCDADGQVVAVSLTAPGQMGVIPAVVEAVKHAQGEAIAPDDVYIVNDSYHGGTHLNDLHLIKPIFSDGELIAFASTKAHHIDVGGRVPGSMSFENTEIFQEGLRIPPLRLYHRGQANETLFSLLRLNVRYPDILFADLEAQRVALDAAATSVLELVDQYSAPTLLRYLGALLDYGERLARARIREWPDGTATFEDCCDDILDGQPIVIRCTVTVAGEDVTVDFDGTSPQQATAINFPPFETVSRVQVILSCCFGPNVPSNSGVHRTLKVLVPEGTILNPRSPAPSSERGLVIPRVGEALLGAMASFVPEGVTAASDGCSNLIRISGQEPGGDPYHCIDSVQGSWGARVGRDGIDGLSNLQTNLTNVPVESLEARYPVRIEEYSLVADSGGPGRQRGGLALRRAWRNVGTEMVTVRCRADRQHTPPYGLDGGLPGALCRIVVERAGQPSIEVGTKAVVELEPNDLIRLTIAGGGGWGDPRERDPDHILRDVREGKISVQHALDAYGVDVEGSTEGWRVRSRPDDPSGQPQVGSKVRR